MIPINQLGFDKLPNCKTTDWKQQYCNIAYNCMVTRVKNCKMQTYRDWNLQTWKDIPPSLVAHKGPADIYVYIFSL